jgi:hypothetical protein
VAALNITIGIQESGFNKTVELSQYKRFERRVVAPTPTQAVFFDSDFDVADDEGLQIKLDVNTKPQQIQPPNEAFSKIVPVLIQSIKIDLPPLITPELAAALPK